MSNSKTLHADFQIETEKKKIHAASLFMDGSKRFTESEAHEKLLQFWLHEKAYFPCAEPTMIIYVKLQVENYKRREMQDFFKAN